MSVVGVNLLWLVPGEVGGSEESTLASVRAMAQRSDRPELRLYLSAALADAHPDLAGLLPTRVAPWSTRSRAARIAAEVSWLAATSRGCDLVHHAGGTVPALGSRPCVLTLHDLQPLERSATHGPLKRAYLALAVPRSVAAARVVVVPSEFVRERVIERFGTDPAKVVAIPHGVRRREGRPAEELRQRHRLAGPVVLYPAITYPHKNHRVLVEAFAHVSTHHPGATLVLTGAPGSEEAAVMSQVSALGLEGRVRRTGRIPAAEVAGLYELADVVAVPSTYEGFGLPAAEAMAHGAPVVAARATALPEVVGDAGALVDPHDVDAWATTLDRLLSDPAERSRRSAAGLARAERWTWSANADALLDVYARALGGASG